MKKLVFGGGVILVIGMASCIGNSLENGGKEQQSADSARVADSLARLMHIENVLDVNSEEELKKKYDPSNVSYDTIWGAEGYFTMGTYLRMDKATHVEIMWMDSAARTGMISATLVSDDDYFAEQLNKGKWSSRTGVYIGMSTDELEKLNGRPFNFSGFGWDYGGGVMSWDGGALDQKGIAVQLSEGANADLPQNEINQVLGDITVVSNNAVLKKLKPRVRTISVAKVK